MHIVLEKAYLTIINVFFFFGNSIRKRNYEVINKVKIIIYDYLFGHATSHF